MASQRKLIDRLRQWSPRNRAELLTLVARRAGDIILVTDPDGRVLEAGDEATRTYGYTAEELRGMSVRDLRAPEAGGTAVRDRQEVNASEGRVWETVHRRKDGSTFPAELRTRTIEVDGVVCRQLVVRDLSESMARDQEIERLNRLYSSLNEVNRAIVHSVNRDEIFQETCRVLVDVGQFQMAWLGWIDPQTHAVVPVARHGSGLDYLREIRIFADDRPEGQGPTGTCIRENRAVVTNNFLEDPRTVPWRQAAARHGFRASVSLPVREADRIGGALTVYAGEADFFGAKEVGLVTESAANVSLALDKLRAEEELRRLTYAVEQAGVGVIITDTQANIEFVNSNFTASTGYTLGEVRGKNPRLLQSGQTPPETFRQLWKALAAGREWKGEFTNRRKDGSTYWEKASITPLRDSCGRITHYLAIKTDITDRKIADEKVREQTALLDVASDAILVHDLDGKVRYWNAAAEKLYGWSAEEVLGRDLAGLGLTGQAEFQTARESTLGEGAWSGEVRHNTKDNREVTVLSRWTLVRDEHGRSKAIFVIDTDITARKALEAQFLRAQRLESVGQLAGGIAHDLNNILAPIVMAAPLIKADVTNPATVRLLELVELNAQRGAEVVKQVLAFSRGQKGERSPLPTRAVMKEIIHIIDETFPKSIALKTAIPEDLWMVEGDATQLHQVLMNLCVNARDAMPEGGTLLLAGENVVVEQTFAAKFPDAKPGPHVVWLVADSGIGISSANLDHVFEPFFSTKPSGKGTGLGLSTVLGIVRQHGGFVRVESQEGKGSQFRVYLQAQPELTPVSEEAPAGEPPLGRGEMILVVDDEESVRVMTRHVLERHGYGVLLAGEGSEAVMTFAQHAGEIQAVLTDLMMPLMDGVALIAALDRMSPGIRILATTGVTDSAQAAAAMRLGASGVLRKPFPPALLLHKMREVLDSE